MKVVVLSTAYPFRGGIAVFSERLAKEFQDHGDEVRHRTCSESPRSSASAAASDSLGRFFGRLLEEAAQRIG